MPRGDRIGPPRGGGRGSGRGIGRGGVGQGRMGGNRPGALSFYRLGNTLSYHSA